MKLEFSRRALLTRVLPATAATGLALARPGILRAAEPLHLKFGHVDNERAVFHAAALKFKEEVEKLSNGGIVIDIFPNSQLGGLRELFEGLQMGVLDFSATASSFVSNFVPGVSVYDLPCLLDDYAHARRTLDGSVGEELNAAVQNNGVVPLGWWEIGFRNITSNKDIKTVEDIKGLRVRIMTSNIYRDMFLQLGADPVPMAWSELFTALQQNVVDAQENPYPQILDNNMFEVQKYLIESEHAYSPALFSMSAISWGRLDKAQQDIIKAAAAQATAVEREATERRAELSKKSLVEEHGMEFRKLDKPTLQTLLRPVYDKYPDLSELVKKVDSYRA